VNVVIRTTVLLCMLSLNMGQAFVTAQEGTNPGFNFDGISAFWEIVAVLEADMEPTEDQWSSFFAAPGYSRLAEEFGRTYFMKALRAVFLSSGTNLAEEMTNEYSERGGFLASYTPFVLDGFREAASDREWQRLRVQELMTFPYLENAAQYALQYLPEESVSEYRAVNFVVFNDSRGYTPLIMGITGDDTPPPDQLECFVRNGDDRHLPFMLLMAHESFHMYRGLVEEISFPEENHPDYPVVWTLDQMVNEGIGDLINRKPLYFGNGCLAGTVRGQRLREEQRAQPATIRIVDRIFSELAADSDLTPALGRQFQSFIPQSGHPTGFFMANLIEEELGAGEILKVVRNPFDFFRSYNRAAIQNGTAPVLSSEALGYLESLEAKYAKR